MNFDHTLRPSSDPTGLEPDAVQPPGLTPSDTLQSVETLRAVLDAVPHPVAVKDARQRWVLVNRAMCAFSGLDAAALLGGRNSDFFPQQQAARCLALERQVLETGVAAECEQPVRCASGHYAAAVVHKQRIRARNRCGEPEDFLVVTFTDTSRFARAEAALRESEAHYRHTFEHSPLYYWTATADGAIDLPSARWAALLQTTPAALSGSGWRNFIHPDDLDWVVDRWARSVADGSSYDVEHRILSLDGAARWYRFRANPRRDETGRIIRWYGTAEDVHERKLATEALRESEDHYRHAVELNPQYPFTTEPDGSLIEISPRWRELVGLSHEDTVGAGWLQVVHPDDLESTQANWREALRTGRRVDHEKRLRLRDGSYRWFRGRAAPRRDAEGRILRWYGSTEDIHDRKLMEMALRESEDHYRHTVELSPQYPFTFSASGGLLEVPPQWLQLVGLTLSDSIGDGWLRTVHPEDLLRVRQEMTRSRGAGVPVDFEYRMRRADGQYRWIRSRAYPRRDAQGRIIRWYGTSEDIHEHRQIMTALRESEEFSRSVLESSPDCIKVLDLDGRLLFVNQPGLAAFGCADFSALEGQRWPEFLEDEFRQQVESALGQARGGASVEFTGYRLVSTGTRWWSVTISPIFGDGQRPVRLLAISRDITESRTAEAALGAAAERLESVLESTTDAVVVLDRDWGLTYANGNALALRGGHRWPEGTRLADIFPEEFGGVFDLNFRRAMRKQTPVTFEGYLASADVWLEVHAFPTEDGLSIFFRDMTERRRYEQERRATQERIEFMAKHDALTGLPNRLLFRERLDQALASASPQSPLAVLCLDLDGFKIVNDTLGHPAGDALLKQVAQRLRDCLRVSDTVARFGGDEFSVVQAGIRDAEDARQMAARIIESLAAPFELDGRPVVIGTSVGIALAEGPSVAGDQLVKSADIALYRAKSEGRGTYRFFEPDMEAHLLARQSLKLSLQGALAREEFQLRYEPILEAASGRVRTLEALIRWQTPQGLVAPASFIPAAEETGQILPIGEWVLRNACLEATRWPGDLRVAVNLSPVQFRNAALVDTVKQALADSGLAPQRLELEITESVLLQNIDCNLAALHALRALGVRIVMDDFGTGYSSLSYLRSFPFDKIKIDRSFVKELPDGAESSAIVRSVVALCRTLGISTTAEGVEELAQLETLQREGCTEVQGHLFGQPIRGNQVPALLTRLRGFERAA